MRLFCELLKDSKRSDRELAKLLGVSQPTVTRTRHKLVREGWVRQFTVVPDFLKMGFTILAISCFQSQLNNGVGEGAGMRALSKPNVVYAAECHCMGMNAVVFSLHKSYSDYVKFLREFRAENGADLRKEESLIISLEGSAIKSFGFKHLAEAMQEEG